MNPLPTTDLRSNLGTWAVPCCQLPAVGNFLHDAAPNEVFDPHFLGQNLETTYFDTPQFDLRKARIGKSRYLTLRIRCYASPGKPDVYALSAKTESEKWRLEITPGLAHSLLRGPGDIASALPAHLATRVTELGASENLVPVVTVHCRRYAVEDTTDRYTLDVDVHTDNDKDLPFAVMEFKSTDTDAHPQGLHNLDLRPIKISKFLWSTKV